MPSDLSSPRLGERAFKTIDDINNLGLHKVTIGEAYVFQVSKRADRSASTSRNYGQMGRPPNLHACKTPRDPVTQAKSFISSGEVLTPHTSSDAGTGDACHRQAEPASTCTLRV